MDEVGNKCLAFDSSYVCEFVLLGQIERKYVLTSLSKVGGDKIFSSKLPLS